MSLGDESDPYVREVAQIRVMLLFNYLLDPFVSKVMLLFCV